MTSHWYSISEIKKIIKRHDKEINIQKILYPVEQCMVNLLKY